MSSQDSPRSRISRRQVIRGLLATGAFGATSKLWVGCTPANDSSTSSSSPPAGKELVMGFIYVGPKDDFGYNQAHFQGKEGVQGVKVVDQASVPETTEVQEAMRNMIEQDKATVLFPTSFGYFDPHILKLATDYPEVQFFHCGAMYDAAKHPKNVGSYFGYIDEAQYVAGVVAGHMSKTGKLGFVAAKPIPQVLRNINSFTLGARSVKPTITTQVIFTGDWSLPVKEAEATNSLIDQGADVITCHVDSPKVVIETAEKRGAFTSGYHANQAALAPKGYLTGAEWDWTKVYSDYVKMIQEGKTLMNGGIPHLLRGGYKDGFVKISAFGPAVSETAKKDAEAARDKMKAGSLVIYKGGLKDNTGKEVVPAGKDYATTAIELESMNWLVEGVVGKTA
ncbi:MAG: BMP family ABC transporter substrate-binding protein [Leptolyngbya sp. UWPOB_LEPTO1]|uniref:BMP family ABC transporter substrate-binding protein n=1 Tax=Leptolyngbya sp. UWPOB_LEPTO1 TaxID=2815653 RepID=UPI001AC870DC|nr:BMP family ABC transporter substrate-binding protein [Leptolyngbya sp. UWPOB_LEPTO1]MBN8561565.1 BMP family ABC transporter substrate-binding protein [Leptolyngbya sp. UWPOB_LEPTO1]